VIESKSVNTKEISFGTKVTLTTKDGKKEVYSIFGPWESDPNNNIISYLSPLGDKLLGNKVGSDLNFSINEREYNYKVESIEVAKF
jgi:transcription elongation GreA/GreB family factor